MGIVNLTPDSFYSASRVMDRPAIAERVRTLVAEGVDILDLGGYSSRPGAADVDPEEEYSRLATGLEVVREVAPEIPVSIDTFRATVARKCIDEWEVDIVNDISGGTLDAEMWPMIAEKRVVYVLMHTRGTPATMQGLTDYNDVTADVITDLSKKVYELRGLGVNDIIIDPGFGFAKTTAQNFMLLDELQELCRMGLPVLVGMSRKTMIWQTLGKSPEEGLYGTVALDALAMYKGADIVRVHDVAPAVATARLIGAMRKERENRGESL